MDEKLFSIFDNARHCRGLGLDHLFGWQSRTRTKGFVSGR
jgi:hypothetical protein